MVDDDGVSAARFGLRRPEFVGRMHEQLDELVAARTQMGRLLQVAIEIGSDLELDATLQRIVTAGMSMTRARYCALGVWAPDGTLASFLHTGMDTETARKLGHLPVGKGVLGLLRNRTDPLRLDDLTQHRAAVGFPEYHPPMRAFLGTPIIIRGEVFGSLYMTDDRPGCVFAEADEITARALASAAAVAIDNARLFTHVRTAARWTDASREITTALLSGVDHHVRPLQLIVERAQELTGAEQAIVLVPADADTPAAEVTELVVSAACGLHSREVIGERVPVTDSTTGEVFRSARPLITASFRRPIQAFTDVGERPAIVMPLRADGNVVGVIAAARNAYEQPFDAGYLDLVRDFADHAAIALTLAAAREYARDLTLVTDRERIAHDLHDQVIQRLFSAGLDLQSTIARLHSPAVIQRLNKTVDDLQAVIDQIRATIFNLSTPPAARGFRQRVQDSVTELTENRDVVTTLRMSGPIGAVSSVLADHAQAVIVEALSNAVRHSGAGNITVEVNADDDLTIDVIDDGRGIAADNKRQSGLANMKRRAEDVGGTYTVSSPPTGGTRVRWTTPLIEA